MRELVGKCPHCEYTGHVGEPCRERVCARKGYHFIPLAYFDQLKNRPFHSRDPHYGLVMGDYLVVGEVGKGGFGKVYLALQLPVLMKAALKLMIRGSSDPLTANSLLKKFEGEALSLARLNHPNIVRLLKYGSFDDMPYLVMEYVDQGRTLKQEVTERVFIGDGFETETSKHIIEQILNALECAHQHKIIHRDIKPENIMLQHVAGDRYFVRILDFGLSKFVEDRTHTSMVAGTPTYMAPEQITGKNIGPWTDLYAVGVISFEMLTGRRPFAGKSRQEIFSRKLDPMYDPLERIRDSGFPEIVMKFFSRAVARDSDDRFTNVHEFRDNLQRVFKEMEKSQRVSISSSDLAQLLDSNELLQLTVVRKRLEEEQARIAEEKEALVAERMRMTALREKMESGNHGPTPQDSRGRNTVALRNSSSDMIRQSGEESVDSLSFSNYARSSSLDPVVDLSSSALRESNPISSSLIERLPKGKNWLSWKLMVPSFTILAVTILFIVNPWSKNTSKVSNNLPKTTVVAKKKTPVPVHVKKPDKSPQPVKKAVVRKRTPVKRVIPAVGKKPIAKKPEKQGGTTPLKNGGATPPTPHKKAPPARVVLRLESEPSGADLILGQKSFGKTPKEWKASPSKKLLLLRISLKGYKSREVKIKQDQSRTYNYTLTKSKKARKLKRRNKGKKGGGIFR